MGGIASVSWAEAPAKCLPLDTGCGYGKGSGYRFKKTLFLTPSSAIVKNGYILDL